MHGGNEVQIRSAILAGDRLSAGSAPFCLTMGSLHATFIVVASMLGTGIMTTSGMVAAATPDAQWALLVWLAGGLQAVLGALCYGAIMARLPIPGGEGALLGHFYSARLGFLTSLLSFVLGFAVANAATAMALEAYARSGLVFLLGDARLGVLPEKSLAVVAIFFMTAVHTWQGNAGMRFQTALAIGKFTILAALALGGLWLAAPGQVAATLMTAPGPLKAFNADPLLWMIFTYSGWNAAIYAAAEFRSPGSTVPRAMFLGCALVVMLYLLLNLALMANLDRQAIVGVIPVMSLLVTHLFGNDAASAFSLLVALALLSSIGVCSFAGPRVLHAALVSRRASTVTPVSRRLVWLQGGVTLFFLLTGTFEQVLSLLGFFLGVFPALTVAGIYFPGIWHAAPQPVHVRYLLAPLFLAVSVIIPVLAARGSSVSYLPACIILGGVLLWRLRWRRVPA